ncbi:MAG: 4'-phosphopantetheinyl transferase superfamily protein [Lachnospiraceae bacterium]|nr:4'-phosphopantetheinyl transferase superfamily protein [Lachnospiraceae bacterium]
MHLYYLFSEPSNWTNLDEALLAYVSEERKKKITAYHQAKDKRQSLYAALLLSYACTDQYDLPFGEIDPLWPRTGKPVLQTHPEIHFSLAHSGLCAAVAVSDEEVGLDAELIGKAPLETMRKAFTPAEALQVCQSADPNLEFYRIWTRKEAYGKYLGTGLSSTVFKTDTLLQEHDCRITEGILKRNTPLERSACFADLPVWNPGSSEDSSAVADHLYFSVYGKTEPAELIPVSFEALMEYVLLCV